MVAKVYFTIWLAGIITAAALYLTGNLTPFLQVVFGFMTFGMLYMGFLSVIPTTIFHGTPKEH